jgi:hypothetical protein
MNKKYINIIFGYPKIISKLIYIMDLIEFLKTHTKINNNFIDDFFWFI